MTRTDDLPDSEIWEASGGVRIPLKDMGENHLRNATKYIRKAIMDGNYFIDGMSKDEGELIGKEMATKLIKLEGEVKRRSNNKPSGPKSLPITKARQEAEDTYRRMMRRD